MTARTASFLYGQGYISAQRLTPVLEVVTRRFHIPLQPRVHPAIVGLGLNQEDPRLITLCRLFDTDDDFGISHFLVGRKPSHKLEKSFEALDLLGHSRLCRASDKRDHVHAFMGLMGVDYSLTVDYDNQNTWDRVFTEIKRRTIEVQRSMSFLSYIIHRYPSTTLPSWVPDWSSDGSLRRPGNDATLEEADVDWLRHGVDATFCEEGKVIQVSGIHMDTLIQEVELLADEGHRMHSRKGHSIRAVGSIRVQDQVWALTGTTELFILRLDGKDYTIVGLWNMK